MCNNKNCNCGGDCKCHNQIILKDMSHNAKDSILQVMYSLSNYIYLTVSLDTKRYGKIPCIVSVGNNEQPDFYIINRPTGFFIRTQKGVRGEKHKTLGRLIADLKRACKQDSRVLSLDKIELVSELRGTKKEVV